MLKDHRPFFLKKTYLRLQDLYVKHFLRPHFTTLGKGFTFIRPWHFELFGAPINVGSYLNVIADSDNRVRITIWTARDNISGIKIGNYCLICPGVRIIGSSEINIGDSCMLANGVYITDSDWHGLYDRITPGKIKPVTLGNNVWIGDRVIICKGVTIGENSIVGAGSVVVNSIPPNSVAAGNPAAVVKQLDPETEFVSRESFFSDPINRYKRYDNIDKFLLGENTLLNWVRTILFPTKGD